MTDEDRRKLIQKFGKANFGDPIPSNRKRNKRSKYGEDFKESKPISAFNMARRV
jgi:hypothetical protein